MPKILVVGGSGYIGSQTNLSLIEAGFETVIFDRRQPVLKSIFPQNQEFFKGDLENYLDVVTFFQNYKVDGVIHFAANIEVGESQENPEKYYYNNVVGTLNLLQGMRGAGVDKLVFSSTAATYGLPKTVPIKETDEKNPINTYGRTKWFVEQILQDYHRSYNLNSVTLRYFNACGADLQGRTGEMHEPESHLIPIIFEVLNGEREFLTVNGNDYNTKDGTCVRDYIHTLDLASAHISAMQKLLSGEKLAENINLGTKNGFSIQEVISTVEKVTGKNVPVKIGQRRAGDPDLLIADNSKAKEILGWEPKYSDLETIIKTAWEWEMKIKNIP